MKISKTKIFIVFIIILVLQDCQSKNDQYHSPLKFTHNVYPLLDTENSRWFYFTSASRPFGMVNLSPDTEVHGTWGSGYRYKIDTVKGFSHIHAWQLSGPSVMPVTLQSTNNSIFKDYYSKFNHKTEIITPGYHQLFLDRYQIKAELTSTKRVGFHRYYFNKKSSSPAILFNLNGQLGPSKMAKGYIQLSDNPAKILGKVTNLPTRRRPKSCTVFFSAHFNAPVKDVVKDSITGNYLIIFKDIPNDELLLKLAVSYTSENNAEINLQHELPHWNFDKIVTEAQEEWNQLLGRIEVEGGTPEQQRRFYTDLWHSLQGRRIINDINGAYPDNTGDEFKIGQLPLDKNGVPLFNHYNSDSFWGAQWTLNTLWGLVYPEYMYEFSMSLLQYYKDGGIIPRGPSGGNYTYVMTGASSTPFIISAIQKNIIKENLDFIYQALKKNHMPGGIMGKAGYEHNTNIGGGLSYYLKNGYVPYPFPEPCNAFHLDGAGQTLEYAYQDWTLAQLATKLNISDEAGYFFNRSKNYVNLFDSISGWMRPKDLTGKWMEDFDPFKFKEGFVEANAAQATWFVPHDLDGLANLMGGKENAASKLNNQFQEAENWGFTSGTSHNMETHPEYRRIPINYGNQPSIQTAYIFNYLNKPWLTQYWSRKVASAVYEGISTNRGYKGDEDQGLMGSLAVLMKIGLFSMKGGCSTEPYYEIGSPIFDKITVHLNQKFYPGDKFVISSKNNGPNHYYIQSATLNGEKLNSWKIFHADIIKGGELILQMDSIPNKKWGVSVNTDSSSQ